jgi:hypothetical protein
MRGESRDPAFDFTPTLPSFRLLTSAATRVRAADSRAVILDSSSATLALTLVSRLSRARLSAGVTNGRSP